MTVSTRVRSLRPLLIVVLVAAVLGAPHGPAGGAENLGERIVRGRVYNLDRGEGVPIASATISFRNLDGSGPGSSGLAVTDANGSFAFAVMLRSRDIVRLTASAPQFEPFTTSERADQLVARNPAIEIGLGAPAPNRHRVRGHLVSGPGCARDAANIQVRLRRAGLSTRSNAGGLFHFDEIEDGDYVLRVGRLDIELPVTVAGRDQEIQLCVDCPTLPTLSPDSAAPGAEVRVESDECDMLDSSQPVTIYFDDQLVASTSTGPFGNFTAFFDVPLLATEGPHRVRVFTEPDAEIASTQVVVTAACGGDCDRDGAVTVAEVLRGVALALGTSSLPCPAYGSAPVTIDQLVGAVDNALNGCDADDDD
jgi:hypothetical protein